MKNDLIQILIGMASAVLAFAIMVVACFLIHVAELYFCR